MKLIEKVAREHARLKPKDNIRISFFAARDFTEDMLFMSEEDESRHAAAKRILLSVMCNVDRNSMNLINEQNSTRKEYQFQFNLSGQHVEKLDSLRLVDESLHQAARRLIFGKAEDECEREIRPYEEDIQMRIERLQKIAKNPSIRGLISKTLERQIRRLAA